MTNCQLCIVENLVKKSCDINGIELSEFNGTKKVKCAVARGLVFTVMKMDLEISYRKIGKIFNKDGKGVFSSVRNMKDEIEVNKVRRMDYLELKKVTAL